MKRKGFTLIELMVATIIISLLSLTLVKIFSYFNSVQDELKLNQLMSNQVRQIKNYFEWSVISWKLKSERKNIKNIDQFTSNRSNIFLWFWKDDSQDFLLDWNNNKLTLNSLPNWKYHLVTVKDINDNNYTVFKKEIGEEIDNEHYLWNSLSLFAWKTQIENVDEERWGLKYTINFKTIPSDIGDGTINDVQMDITISLKWKEKSYSFLYNSMDF